MGVGSSSLFLQFPIPRPWKSDKVVEDVVLLGVPPLLTNTHTPALSLSYFPSAVVIPTTTLQLAGGGDPGMHGQYISGQEFYVPAGEFWLTQNMRYTHKHTPFRCLWSWLVILQRVHLSYRITTLINRVCFASET